MEEWVQRALQRWPNVPALYGWLKLDRRGRWLIKGETISRPQIIDVINRNYTHDEQGRWYFQNGPQRGYMQLERAPFILQADSKDTLQTHSQLSMTNPSQGFLDEAGGLFFLTEHGPAALRDSDLDWALARMLIGGGSVSENNLAVALSLPSGTATKITLRWNHRDIPLTRLDDALAPAHLGFVREPKPLPDERAAF